MKLNGYKKYLQKEFGTETGKSLFTKATKILEQLKKEASYAADEKMYRKNVDNSILPAVAFYRTLTEHLQDKEKALAYLREWIGGNMKNTGRKLSELIGKIPVGFALFRKMYSIGLKGKSWNVEFVTNEKHLFEYNITGCVWADKFREYGCPEVCHIFCHNDVIMFEGLDYIRFTRKQTCVDGEYCDFHFARTKKGKEVKT